MNDYQAFSTAKVSPSKMELLFRTQTDQDQIADFKERLAEALASSPDDRLLQAWAWRLDLAQISRNGFSGNPSAESSSTWGSAIIGSLVLGICTAVLAQGKVPIPFAIEESVFWAMWSPAIGIGFLVFLAATTAVREHLWIFLVGAVVCVALGAFGLLLIKRDAYDLQLLAALHLPFVVLSTVGIVLCLSYRRALDQAYGFLLKSMEAILTGAIYAAAIGLFLGLSAGIFEVLGVYLPDTAFFIFLGFAVGAVPLLAAASVYNPGLAPRAQDFHSGLARTLRVVCTLLLPLALAVMLAYVLWFIPMYWERGFENRDTLMIYNATIIAILTLVVALIAGGVEFATPRQQQLMRWAVAAILMLTTVLNVYAFACILNRTFSDVLTINRFTVIGWNTTTLLILLLLGWTLWRANEQAWISALRDSLGYAALLATGWAAIIYLTLPLFAA